jgi:hypothetical protein
VSVPRKDQNFLCHMLWSFVCSMIWGERWLFIFVDIGGIVDHHCSNFLFINFLLFNLPWVTMNHTALTEPHIKKENIYDLLMKIRSVIATWQFYVNACYTKKKKRNFIFRSNHWKCTVFRIDQLLYKYLFHIDTIFGMNLMGLGN